LEKQEEQEEQEEQENHQRNGLYQRKTSNSMNIEVRMYHGYRLARIFNEMPTAVSLVGTAYGKRRY